MHPCPANIVFLRGNVNFDAGLVLYFYRATEENNKLKTRYEQAKEEIENLVSKLIGSPRKGKGRLPSLNDKGFGST